MIMPSQTQASGFLLAVKHVTAFFLTPLLEPQEPTETQGQRQRILFRR